MARILVIDDEAPIRAVLRESLTQEGHEVRLLSRTSGLGAILVTKDGLEGGADKRREGKALGD